MNRAEVLQEVRLMKFDELYSRRTADKLTQEQAAEILGISVRTMRRWEERYEAEGAEGLYDRRLGKLANNRVPADTGRTGFQPYRGLAKTTVDAKVVQVVNRTRIVIAVFRVVSILVILLFRPFE